MVRPTPTTSDVKSGEPATPAARPFSFADRLREISMFFDGTDRVHQAMRAVAALFEQNGIAHAIIGGMAVNAHRYVRTTGDVDFLVRPEALPVIRRLVDQGLIGAVSGRSRRFTELSTGIMFDVLIAGRFPGSGNPGPVAFPDPSSACEVLDGLNYINLKSLIELKLAAHRYRDFGDVVELIRFNDLDESFASKLHESVRADYIECLEEKRREDEYERRADADMP